MEVKPSSYPSEHPFNALLPAIQPAIHPFTEQVRKSVSILQHVAPVEGSGENARYLWKLLVASSPTHSVSSASASAALPDTVLHAKNGGVPVSWTHPLSEKTHFPVSRFIV